MTCRLEHGLTAFRRRSVSCSNHVSHIFHASKGVSDGIWGNSEKHSLSTLSLGDVWTDQRLSIMVSWWASTLVLWTDFVDATYSVKHMSMISADTVNSFGFHPSLPLAASASGHRRFKSSADDENDDGSHRITLKGQGLKCTIITRDFLRSQPL